MSSRASGRSRCAFEWRSGALQFPQKKTSSAERTMMAHMNRGPTLNDEPSSASSLPAAARKSRERVPGALRRSPSPASSRMRFRIEDLFECKAGPTRGEGAITLGPTRRGLIKQGGGGCAPHVGRRCRTSFSFVRALVSLLCHHRETTLWAGDTYWQKSRSS